MCALCGPLEQAPRCPRCQHLTAVPWESRGEMGMARALWATWVDVMVRPAAFGRQLLVGEEPWGALAYAALLVVVGSLPALVVAELAVVQASRHPDFSSTAVPGVMLGVLLSWLVVCLLVPPIVALWALSLVGVARSVGLRTDFSLAVRVLAYGGSLVALPLLGPFAFPLWLTQQVVVASQALRGDRGAAGPYRASLAVGALPALLVLLALVFAL